MFDSTGDAESMYSRSSRMGSLIMENGQSMQQYYQQLQADQMEAAATAAARAQQPGGSARPRRNSGSSVMSDTERLYGWSGSRGGVANEHTAPKFRINSGGKLVLAEDVERERQEQEQREQALAAAAAKAAKPAKPAYRPAFAPSADLPPSEDEREEPIDDDDRPIQHDLPTTRPLRARTSLKQKLGSVLARVGSVRKSGSTPPAVASATSPAAASTSPGAVAPAQDYLSVKRSNTTGGTSPSSRPEFRRARSSVKKPSALGDTAEVDENTMPTLSPGLAPPTESDKDDDIILTADGGHFQGGFTGLARKLSRRATTAGSGAGAAARRSRSVPREGLRAERERKAEGIMDKAAAEEMLRDLAQIPLYKPPRSANLSNRKPLSSFPPRAPLHTSAEANSLANAPRYTRPVKDADGTRRERDPNALDRATTVSAGLGRDYSSYKSSRNRTRSGSTPSVMSSTALLPGGGEAIPPVPPLPELTKDQEAAPKQGGDWTSFKKSESSNTIAKQA